MSPKFQKRSVLKLAGRIIPRKQGLVRLRYYKRSAVISASRTTPPQAVGNDARWKRA